MRFGKFEMEDEVLFFFCLLIVIMTLAGIGDFILQLIKVLTNE